MGLCPSCPAGPSCPPPCPPSLSRQVLASYINPAGSGGVHTFETSSSETMSQNSSALPAMLQELLSQSCLIPAMSSYLRNDSGRDGDVPHRRAETCGDHRELVVL